MSDTVTIDLDQSTLDALDQLARKIDSSRSALASQAVQDYVALSTWQLRKTELGLQAAGRGDFASDAEVVRVRAKFAPKA